MSKRKQDSETSDDSDRVKRVKDNLGVAKPATRTRLTFATDGQSAQTKTTDKGKGKGKDKGTRKDIPDAPTTNVTLPPSTSDAGPPAPVPAPPTQSPAPPRKRLRIQKLAPPRPFPTVPPGRSATGPRSTSMRPSPDEPMCLCVTRKTALAAYIRRCKSAFMQNGAREIRLSAMGAAIPHLALLVGSLTTEGVLPFAEDELKVEVYTGSEEVVDEVLSDSESDGKVEDTDTPKEEFRKRTKSTMNVIIRHASGNTNPAEAKSARGSTSRGRRKRKRKGKVSAEEEQQSGADGRQRIVIQEPEQED